jgi:predicted small lipoprotein YifL
MQKAIFKTTVLLLLAVGLTNCKKKKPLPTPEATLAISTDVSSAVQNPGATFSFTTKITSAMPANGVKLDVEVKEEISGNIVPQATGFSTSNANTPTQIINLPVQKWCVCTIKATSLSTASNTATTSFRVVNK